MQTVDRQRSAEVARRLIEHPELGTACGLGLERLFSLFEAARSRGTLFAVNHFRGAVPEERVAAACTSFVAEMRENLSEDGQALSFTARDSIARRGPTVLIGYDPPPEYHRRPLRPLAVDTLGIDLGLSNRAAVLP